MDPTERFGEEFFTQPVASTPSVRTTSALRSRVGESDSSGTARFSQENLHSSRVLAKQNSSSSQLSDTTNSDVYKHHVSTPSVSSQRSKSGSATPVRDRLRRKSELRQNTFNSSDDVKTASSGIELLPSKLGAKNFSKENSGKAQAHREKGEFHVNSRKSKLKEEYSVQKTGLSRQGTSDSLKGSNSSIHRHHSEASVNQRPVSSNLLPTSARARLHQEQRPSSSKSVTDLQRKTTSQSYDDVEHPDSVVADLMMSRMQADNWMDDDGELDDGNRSFDVTKTDTRLPSHSNQSQSLVSASNKQSDYSTTQVRPFSGLSITSASGDFSASDRKRRSHGRPSSVMSAASGRESRAIIMEGEDLSSYDNYGARDEQNTEDKQSLDQLEWELASDTGRITADGRISQQSLYSDVNVMAGSSKSGKRSSAHRGIDTERQISHVIREDEKLAQRRMEEEEGRQSRMMDEDDVRALR